jgi:hypothetical protein
VEFNGVASRDLPAILFANGPSMGLFAFQIDAVQSFARRHDGGAK